MKLEKQSEVFWVSSVRHTGVTLKGIHFSLLPHSSAPMRSLHTISMQTDREFEKEHIGTLFVPRGAVLGGLGGGPCGSPTQNLGMVLVTFFNPPENGYIYCYVQFIYVLCT